MTARRETTTTDKIDKGTAQTVPFKSWETPFSSIWIFAGHLFGNAIRSLR
jgi:hypothetical protein